MAELKIKATEVFSKNWAAMLGSKRFIKNEGGSRSSKTYSLCQVIILYALQNKKKTISIIRRTGPALMSTVFRDFKEVMEDMGLWEDKLYSKGKRTYTFATGTFVEFFSADEGQKLRGHKRDIAWINEANEIPYDIFQQINLRTNDKIIIDYNPSDIASYLYELPPANTIALHSTYKDNPFLSPNIIKEIEAYKLTDEDYYTTFALGLRAHSKENVYTKWKTVDVRPANFTDFIYAIDYGYTHPTAMVKIWYDTESRAVYIEETIYETHLTSTNIISRMEDQDVEKSVVIVSETARPEIIADITAAGYTVVPAIKDVKDGLNNAKTFTILLAATATNLIRENQNYKFKKVNGVLTEEVTKLFDDGMDAIRYGLMYIKKYLLKGGGNLATVYSFEF